MLPDVIDIDETKASPIEPFPLVAASELVALPIQTIWLVANFIEKGSLNLLFGEPGAGKSLFALDWAFCMASGIDWHGYSTQKTDVVIICGEGYAGIARRLLALADKYNAPVPERLFISQRPAQLLDEINAQWVAESIVASCPTPGLVIVDTLHRNMDGDENSSQDIGRFINNLDYFIRPLGAAVLAVHHSGHSNNQRSRGSSSIRAAMDAEFSATKSESGISLACHKAKDFEATQPMLFGLKPVALDCLDNEGEPLTSVYLEHLGIAKPSTSKRKLSARDEAILTSLDEATRAHGIEPPTEIKVKFSGFNQPTEKHRQVVHIDHWRNFAYKSIVVDANTEDAKRMAFKRCRNKLLNQSLTVEYDNYAWRILD